MKRKPNILFILSDDQGYYSLGCLHHSELRTPNLDKLAEDGILFSNCYCASPVCSPARASILTGYMPSVHGVHDWLRAGNIDPSEHPLTSEEKTHYDYDIETRSIDYLEGLQTYPEVLAENGYVCALSGKWHLGDSIHPKCGFSKWYTIGKGGVGNYMDPDVVENGKITFPKQYITDLISDKAIQYLEELSAGDQPFYLSVHYNAPHMPWYPASHKAEHLNLYQNCDYDRYYPFVPDHPWSNAGGRWMNHEGRYECLRGYEAAVTAMDEGIGRIMDALEKSGQKDNTIVIFTADNGFSLGQHGFWGKGNGTQPLNMYETSVRVPFIIRCPESLCKNVKSEYVISHCDLFPTLLELCGIPCPQDEKRPGKSFVPALRDASLKNDRDVVVYDEYGYARMIRTAQYKYVHRYPGGPHALYDMQNDPGEEHNLYGDPQYDAVVLDMRKRLREWFIRHSDPASDGVYENIDGSGQLCRCGLKAEGTAVSFHQLPKEKQV